VNLTLILTWRELASYRCFCLLLIRISYALIYPQSVTLYQVDDQIYEPIEVATTNLFNTFLDALDGVSHASQNKLVLADTPSPTVHTVLSAKLATTQTLTQFIPTPTPMATKVNCYLSYLSRFNN
jgi:hypothetical protein